jgi:prepilin-type N-terminal cleavage/methylation domain-containing protein
LTRQQGGFTLIEVTVALVITSMLAGLLTSALFFAGRTRQAVTAGVQDQIQNQINLGRFEQVLSHCMPGVEGGEVAFRGTEKSLECLSMQSMSAQHFSQPMKVQWRIQETADAQIFLEYADESLKTGVGIPVARLPSSGKFVYWTHGGASSSTWPPSAQQALWLPGRVEIKFENPLQTDIRWMASFQATPQPQLNPPSLFGTELR